MTESEWLAGIAAGSVLKNLAGHYRSRVPGGQYLASDRKLRLFAAACCRQVWHLLADPRSRRAVEIAEGYADGLATGEELREAEGESVGAWMDNPGYVAGRDHHAARASACCRKNASALAAECAAWWGYGPLGAAAQAALLRCLFGNPWRPVSFPCPVAGFDGVRRDHPAVQIARTIYAERRWGDLPVLADALEEAGCTDAAALAHCREPLHGRGCWVLDLILGKE